MGDAGFASRFIGSTNLVPHHMGDNRRPVVRNHHHLHAIVQGEGLDLAVGGIGGKNQAQQSHTHGNQPENRAIMKTGDHLNSLDSAIGSVTATWGRLQPIAN